MQDGREEKRRNFGNFNGSMQNRNHIRDNDRGDTSWKHGRRTSNSNGGYNFNFDNEYSFKNLR